MGQEKAFAGMAIMMMFTMIMVITFAVTWIYSIINVLKSDFKNPSNKTVWTLMLLFIPPLGVILYHFIGKEQRSISKK